jgi:tripartite-type tricarboxylate transporter receptor subunit TctC
MKLLYKGIISGLVAIFAGLVSNASMADTSAFPTRTMTLVVPFAPGGTSDLLARLFAQKMTILLGKSMIVINKSGADGAIGARFVATSDPDGHTLVQISTSHVILPSLRKQPYNWRKDLTPVYGWLGVPQFLVVNSKSSVHSIKDLVALAKSHAGGVNFGSGGTGTLGHLTGVELLKGAGVAFNHIPYRGLGPEMDALLANQLDVGVQNYTELLPQAKAGTLRPIAVTSEQRMPELPEVPTAKELGVPDATSDSWTVIMVPTGTPQPVIKTLHDSFAKVVSEPDVQARLKALGVDCKPLDLQQLQQFLNSEAVRWQQVIEKNGVHVE